MNVIYSSVERKKKNLDWENVQKKMRTTYEKDSFFCYKFIGMYIIDRAFLSWIDDEFWISFTFIHASIYRVFLFYFMVYSYNVDIRSPDVRSRHTLFDFLFCSIIVRIHTEVECPRGFVFYYFWIQCQWIFLFF